MKIKRAFRWLTRTPRRKTAWVLLVAYLINQFVYPLVPFLKDNSVKANGTIEPVTLGTSLFVNRNPDFNVWFGDRLDQSKHKVVFEVDGKEIELRLQQATEASPSGEIDQLISQLRKELQKPVLTSVNNNDALDQRIGDKATIRYEILPDRGVKESILIEDRSAVTNQYVFEMKLSGGVQLKSRLENLSDTNLNATGSATTSSYYFVDSKNKYLANFEPLIMIDAAGAMSNNIEMDITPSSCLLATCYSVTLIADETWLNDPLRAYPVNLDPTIVHEQNPDFSSGTENRTQINALSAVEGKYKELQTDNNTVGLWHFNEGSGTTAADSSGNSNTGTLTNGVVWNGQSETQTGLGKSSLYFDGVNDYVTRADDSDFDFLGTDNFTVEGWFKTNGAVSAINIIAAKVSVVAGVGYKLYLDASGDVCFGTDGTAGSFPADSACTSAVDYDDSAWHHVAAVRRGTADIRIYVDGVEVGTPDVAIGDTATLANAGALYIGIDGDAATTPFKGWIDEIRISNIARTPEEIAADANRYPYSVHESPVIDFGTTPNTLDSLNYTGTGIRTGDAERPFSRDGLVAQWDFNETSGTTAYNTAGSDSCSGTPSSCNLTLNNFASTSSQDQAAGTGWTANDRRWGAGAINVSSVATADTISLSNPTAIDPNSADLSIETWIKTNDVTAELFSNNSANGVSCTSDGYYLGIDASGYPVFTLDTDGATAGCDATITTGILKKVNDGIWHHIVATVTRGSAAYLYVDGVIVGSDTSITAYTSEAPSGNVLLGSTNAFDGALDSTRFYARALTTSEVLSNSQNSNIEFQTRTSADNSTWEAWKTTSGTGDTQIDSLDNVIGVATPSAIIWQGAQVATSSSSLVVEGAASLRTKIGTPQREQSVTSLWHMDETSGSGAYIKDDTNTNNGTPTGTTVVDGFYGKGRSFNGSSDFINVKSGAIATGNTYTISGWFKTTSADSTRNVYAEGGTGVPLIRVAVNSTGTMVFFHRADSGTSATITSSGTYNDGKWHHFSALRLASNSFDFYLDGVSVGTSSSAPGTTTITKSNIGAREDNGSTIEYFSGSIDEIKVDSVARSADEIAEAYRAGRDHRISTIISSTDLSSKTKLPFYFASDRPGTFAEATIGESAFANYEPDSNTHGLWHLEEAAGSGAYIKDSSGNSRDASIGGGTTTNVQGKIGKARKFNGSSDYLSLANTTATSFTAITVSTWVKFGTASVFAGIVDRYTGGNQASTYNLDQETTGARFCTLGTQCASAAFTHSTTDWTYLVGTYDGTTIKTYVNGVHVASQAQTGTIAGSGSNPTFIGTYGGGFFSGNIDEVRIDSTARTADEIRQAYEVGKRTHTITNDFVTSPQAAYTSGTTLTINNPSGTTNLTDTLAKGDTIIFKENVNGTETLSQATVTAITNTSTSYGTVTVSSAPSFPSGGYTTAAKIFKWQREFMDLTQITQGTHRDALTRITLRVTDGSQGANIWLDDFESADYSDGSRATIGSTAQRYFQYRAILNGSPTLSNVTINYNSGTVAQTPKTKDSSTDFSATGSVSDRITDTGSSNSPQLELSYKELPTDINTRSLYHFSNGTCATDSSGNSYTLTANGGMTCATGGKFGYAASGFATTPVSYSHTTLLDTALTSGTIEAWINPANLSAVQTILYADSTSDTLLTLGTSGQINFATSGSTNLATANSLIAASSWYHIAASWTAAGHKIYVNGVEVASDTNTTTHTSQDYTTYIGVGSGGNTLPFSSFIDEVRISNIARTPEEIRLDAQRRPYGVYTSDVQNLGSNVSSINNLRWTENGVQTGDGETPYSTNGLVAQWNFNETSGTTAVSIGSCGSSCNGTLTNFASTTSQDQAIGTGWTKDNRKWGAGALTFDGSNDYVVTGTNALATGASATDFTVELWANVPNLTSNKIFVLQQATSPRAGDYAAYITSTGANLYFQRYTGTTNTVDQIYVPTTGLAGAWHHFVFTWSGGTGGTRKIYIDGIDKGGTTADTQDGGNFGNLPNTTIGGGTASHYNNATIDTVRIYNRALGVSEIKSNYNNGNVEIQTRTGTTSTPNDGTWEAWKPSGTATEIQLAAMDNVADIATPSANISRGILVATSSASLAAEGTGSLKIETGKPALDQNVVGLWRMDETSGSGAYIKDATANANHGTPTGTTVIDGFYGKARSFNGSSDHITMSGTASETEFDFGTGDFSVETWVKLNALSNYIPIIGSWSNVANSGDWRIYGDASGNVGFSVGAGGSEASNKLKVGQWQHVAGVRRSGTIYVYVDGVQVSTAANSNTSNTTTDIQIGKYYVTALHYLNGFIDEVKISNSGRSDDEIAEAYRAGRDHRVSKTLNSNDLSSKTKLPFYFASDRPGTFAEATIGESAYANYEPDANTVGLWRLEERSGSGAYFKDSSGNGNDGTPTGSPAFIQGKMGSARYFNGTSDFISFGTSSSLFPTVGTIDAWTKLTALPGANAAWVYSDGEGNVGRSIMIDGSGSVYCGGSAYQILAWINTDNGGGTNYYACTGMVAAVNTWYHITMTYNGTTLLVYVNGVLAKSTTYAGNIRTTSLKARIGSYSGNTSYLLTGLIDEVRNSNVVRTPDEIRQAYEVGKRTHQITNDFVTTPQAAYTSGTSVTINNPYGTTNLTDTLNVGDTIIFKENVNGTETVSQATVTGVTNTSSTYGTVTVLAAPTFPSGGYTTAATVFKWQREWFDITSSLTSQRDAINRITLRVTDGSQGANIWIDDIKTAGPYLSNPTSRNSSVASTPQKFVQYRVIFSTTDSLVSPNVNSVALTYNTQPKRAVGSDTLGAAGSLDKDGNTHLGSNNVKKVAFYDRTKDQISYGLDFDGSNDFTTMGNATDFNPGTGNFSYMFWTKLPTAPNLSYLLAKAYDNPNYGVLTSTAGQLVARMVNSGGTAYEVYAGGYINDNQWHHIAVTYNRTGNLTLYIDGAQSGTPTSISAESALNLTNTNDFTLGANCNTSHAACGNYFNGLIDEGAYFNTLLTQSQIEQYMNLRRLTGSESSLKGLWHFDEGQGKAAFDSSANSNHGTLINMAATAWVNSQNDRDQNTLSQQVLGIDPNWANGVTRKNTAMNFNGSSNYLSYGDVYDGIYTNMTAAAWIKTTSTGILPILSKWYTTGASFVLRINGVSTNVAEFSVCGNTGCSTAVNVVGTTVVNDGKWHYIVGTNDNTNIKIYVDGKLENTTAVTASTSAENHHFCIGNYCDTGGTPYASGYFAGEIDEAALFSIARTATQISTDYAARRFKGNESNLVGLWHFDEGADNLCSGAVKDVCDASTSAQDGTANGTTTWTTDARAVMDNNARYISLGSSSATNTDKGMEIYAISTTQFKYRWTGDQTWSSAVNFSSYPFATPAQLGTTGVYVGFDTTNGTFGDESYFLIPSWAIQQFSTTRGVRRSFPERSYLVATDRSVDIIDADDNTLWMRTSNGVANNLLGTQTLNVPSSLTMNNGQLMIATNGTAGTGVYRLDFNRDVAYRYNATNRTTGNNNLAKRHATDWSWGSADTGQNLIDSIVNDVSLLTSNGRLVMATANNTGLTKIANIMSTDTSYDYSDVTSNAYNRVRLAENYLSGTGAVGDMYALNSTNNALERWNNVVADSANETNGTPDATVNATSTPALFASAQTVNDLDIKTGTSLANAGNNTVFVGHAGGTTVFQENRATLASSSVKYSSITNISEEMIGDIQGMWPLDGLTDQSLKANTLTNNNTVTFTTSGVRGKAASFASASSQYLNKTDNAGLSVGDVDFTIGAWVKMTDTTSGERHIIAKGDFTTGSSYEYLLSYTGTSGTNRFRFLCGNGGGSTGSATANNLGAPSAGTWYFIVGWHDASANTINIQVNNGTADSTSYSSGCVDTATDFVLGRMGNRSLEYWNGQIDEAFLTKKVLTADQRTALYVAGKEALNNKYRVKLASDTVNQLAGSTNVVKGVAASDNYIFAGTNTTGADDGILSRTLLRGDVTDKTYDESTTDPVIVDNDINSVAVSSDGAYIIVGTDDQGITIIHNGSATNRLRSGGKVQGPSKRPSN